MLGIHEIIRRTAEEQHPWLPNHNQQAPQAHDEPDDGQEIQQNSYFRAPQFYCVETMCAPCGVVIAWTKFVKAESPTNIINWLNSVYPNVDQQPDYVCIDKACLVLWTAITNGSWEIWKQNTWFIVDSYHYINHCTTDYLCDTWCNPSPLNGSQPYLIAVEYDKDGNPHYKQAFNTQVSWLFVCDDLKAKYVIGVDIRICWREWLWATSIDSCQVLAYYAFSPHRKSY